MVNVQLPLPGTDVFPMNKEVYDKIQDKLLKERNVYSAYFIHNGNWWTRCSAQVYNDVSITFFFGFGFEDELISAKQISDFTKLGEAWLQICKEILEECNLPPYKPDADLDN